MPKLNRPRFYKNGCSNGTGVLSKSTSRRRNLVPRFQNNNPPELNLPAEAFEIENFQYIPIIPECAEIPDNNNNFPELNLPAGANENENFQNNPFILEYAEIPNDIYGNFEIPQFDNVENNDEDDDLSWIHQRMYPTGDLTVGEAIQEIMDFFIATSLTKIGLERLIQLLHVLLPQPNNLPKSQYRFLKLLYSLLPSDSDLIRKHQICEDCFYYLGCLSNQIPKKICEQCKGKNTRSFFVEYNLKQVIKNAFETRNLKHFIDRQKENVCDDNYIQDFSSGSEYKKIQEKNLQPYDLTLLWNTDGAPVSKSSKGEIWPIQVQLLDVPPNNRRSFQFICGIYYSTDKKPNMNSFLKPFSIILNDLYENGVDWYDKTTNTTRNSKIIAPIATLDCPARAAVQNLMQFNGEFGCSFCEAPGQTFMLDTGGHKRVYPVLDEEHPLRTKEKMIRQAKIAMDYNLQHFRGVKGPTIAATLPCFDVAKGFVPDYMHAVLSGVVTMMTNLWFETKNNEKPYYINNTGKKRLDNLIQNITPPDYIARCPRTMKFKNYFKASEMRDFLLCYYPALLDNILPKVYYQNFLLLSYGMRILLQTKIPVVQIQLVKFLFDLFSREFQSLYKIENCSFNVHQLSHLVDCVVQWGPPWVWSCFTFEDANGYFKKLNHGPNKIDMEIMNTIKMINATYILKSKLNRNQLAPEGNVIFPIGTQAKTDLNPQELEGLNNFILNQQLRITEGPSVYAYFRAQINNEILTSKRYQRQKKRDNSVVSWNQRKFYGIIEFFIFINNCVNAVVRVLLKDSNRAQNIHPQVELSIEELIIPIRFTLDYTIVPLSEIDCKVMLVNDYLYFPPNRFENKL
ncbi:hypothetical protein TKK_0003487 [Trichogramma kaykai]